MAMTPSATTAATAAASCHHRVLRVPFLLRARVVGRLLATASADSGRACGSGESAWRMTRSSSGFTYGRNVDGRTGFTRVPDRVNAC